MADQKPTTIDTLFRGLTGKQLRWLRAYLDEHEETFMNATASARVAGYKCGSKNAFEVIGCQNVGKFKDRISLWLEEEGLSERRLKSKILYLMEAKETKFFQKDGLVVDERQVEALGTQKSALELALKVKGMFAPEAVKIEGLEALTERLAKALERVGK